MIKLMKGLPMVVIFLLGAPLLLIFSLRLISLPGEMWGETMELASPEVQVKGARVFAALPESNGMAEFSIETGDARQLIVGKYLESLNSPLTGLEREFVEAADTFSLDFRLLVAIARQESNLCKFIPEGSYNCWGWGIHKRGTLGFESYEEGIWTVARGLRENYLDSGLETPEEIMSRYTPSSNGSWAFAVKQFIEEME